MPSKVKVAFNRVTRIATLMAENAATPGGSVSAGTFTPRLNKASAVFVRELLYKLGYQNMQNVRLTTAPGVVLS